MDVPPTPPVSIHYNLARAILRLRFFADAPPPCLERQPLSCHPFIYHYTLCIFKGREGHLEYSMLPDTPLSGSVLFVT